MESREYESIKIPKDQVYFTKKPNIYNSTSILLKNAYVTKKVIKNKYYYVGI